MRIRGVDLINYIIYKGLVSCWGPKPLASEVMSSSPSMLSIVVGFWSSAMVGNIWYLFHWRWLPNFTRSLRSSLAMLSSSLVEIGPVGDDLFKSCRRIGAPWPSWCGCIVCAMSNEQQCAMCLSDYDLSHIKISCWRSLLEFLRGFVCLDEAPYTARWPWCNICHIFPAINFLFYRHISFSRHIFSRGSIPDTSFSHQILLPTQPLYCIHKFPAY